MTKQRLYELPKDHCRTTSDAIDQVVRICENESQKYTLGTPKETWLEVAHMMGFTVWYLCETNSYLISEKDF